MPIAPREVGRVAQVANQTTSGSIGSAVITTDVRVVEINQTTSGLTLSLPTPSDASAVVALDVVNIGTASFTMLGVLVASSTTLRCAWSGSAWMPEAVPVSTTTIAPSFTVANLPTQGVTAGQMAWASNGRAITGVAALSSGFAVQSSGAGTGCLVTYSALAGKWQIAGTTMTVSA